MSSDQTERGRVALAGYLLLGAIGTAVIAVALSRIAGPLQRAVYASFYLQLGPWQATEAAMILGGAIVGLVAIGIPTLVAAFVGGARDSVPAIAVSFAALFGVSMFLLVFAAFVDLFGVPAAGVVFAVALVLVPAGLRFLRVGTPTVAAYVGGLAVLGVLAALVAFGLGWGGGYYLVAEEVPESSVNGSVPDFDETPEVRDDLFRPVNREAELGEPIVYRLNLRGSDHGTDVAGFLDRNGVQCPYLTANASESDSFVATHDGAYYRVRCVSFED